ncbi:MAG: hypothetical protein HRU19_00575 [Pseudobacteriovorax sp.]|nr:hypothetical protein [Pseudobacteriovorax sp.]
MKHSAEIPGQGEFSLLKSIRKIGQSFVNSSRDDTRDLLNKNLAYIPVRIHTTLPEHRKQPTVKQSHLISETILYCYFGQIYSPHGIVPDLRQSSFFQKYHEIYWNPRNLVYSFEDQFRTGIIAVYKGIFEKSDSCIREGLYMMFPNLSTEASEFLLNLIKQHTEIIFSSKEGQDPSNLWAISLEMLKNLKVINIPVNPDLAVFIGFAHQANSCIKQLTEYSHITEIYHHVRNHCQSLFDQ